MNNNNKKYRMIRIRELFDCETCPYYGADYSEKGSYPYISRTSFNNGCVGFVDNPPKEKVIKGECITIGAEGIYAFYQEKDFVSGVKIYTLRNKELNKYSALYLCTILNKENYRYSYGRARILKNIQNEIIPVPVNSGNKPDWKYMENFIKSAEQNIKCNNKVLNDCLNTKNKSLNEKTIVEQWRDFKLEDIFNIKKGKRLTSEDQTVGKTPYVGAIDSNNGIANYIGQQPIHTANTISLSYNGSVGEAFYQDNDFWATDDVNVLYIKDIYEEHFNKYIAMFICTLLKLEKYRYSYGRKWVLESMKTTTIKLPVTNEGLPDWQYMENYIKSLPYGDKI